MDFVSFAVQGHSALRTLRTHSPPVLHCLEMPWRTFLLSLPSRVDDPSSAVSLLRPCGRCSSCCRMLLQTAQCRANPCSRPPGISELVRALPPLSRSGTRLVPPVQSF